MIEDLPIIIGNNDTRIQLVRGCPCLREFGNERVCVNNDDVMPIKSMTIDPEFFVQLGSIEDLQDFRSDREDLCYGLVSLDSRDGKAYCISQGLALKINKQNVQASDIKDALNFVVPSKMGSDDVVCSSCLYKYLITLTDVFDDILSPDERGKVILDYAQDLVNRIASELAYGELHYHSNSLKATKNASTSQLVNRHYSVLDYINDSDDERIKDLLQLYKQLSKLEAVFLNQVISIDQETTDLLALTLVQLMVGTTRKILTLHDKIRDLTHTLLESKESSRNFIVSLKKTEAIRRKSEKDFRKLMPILSEIRSRPT